MAPLALAALCRGLPDHIPGLEESLGAPEVLPASSLYCIQAPPRRLLGPPGGAHSCLVPTHLHRVCPSQLTASRQPWGVGLPGGNASLQNPLPLLRPGFFPLNSKGRFLFIVM